MLWCGTAAVGSGPLFGPGGWLELVEQLTESALLVDGDCRVCHAGRAVLALLGLRLEALLATPFDLVVNGGPTTALIARADGSSATVVLAASPLGGKRAGCVVTVLELPRADGQTLQLLQRQRDVTCQLAGVATIDAALDVALAVAGELPAVECAGVYLAAPVPGCLQLVRHRGVSSEFAEAAQLIPSEPFASPVLPQTSTASMTVGVRATEFHARMSDAARAEGMRGVVFTTITNGESVLGLLIVASRQHDRLPTEALLAAESLAAQAGVALDRLRAEAQRRRHEERYRLLFEQSGQCILMARADDRGTVRIVEANASAAAMLQATPAELVGRDLLDFAPAGRRDAWQTQIERLVTGERIRTEIARPLSSGGEVPLEIEAGTVHLAEGPHILVYGRDVSEQHLLAQERLASEERLALALHGANLALWDLNLATGRASLDDHLAVLLDYEPGELGRWVRGLEPLVARPDRALFRRALSAHLAGRQPMFEAELRLLTKFGGEVWVLARGRTVARDEAGQPLRLAGTFLDISARKRSEEEAERAGSFLKTLLDHTSMPVLAKTVDEGRIVLWNRACSEVVGVSEENALGRTDFDLFPREQAEAFRQGDLAAVAKGSLTLELPVARYGRHDPLWLRTTKYPVLDEDHRARYVLVLGQDVTEQRRAAEANRRSKHQEAIAELGQRALSARGLDELFAAALRLVTASLAVDCTAVLEWQAERSQLALVAGSGWSGAPAQEGGTDGSWAGPPRAALPSEAPVVCDARGPSVAPPEWFVAEGLVAGVSLRIKGPERPFGVLMAYCRHARTFDDTELEFLDTVANLLATAVERIQLEDALRGSELRYRALVETAPQGVINITSEGLVVLVNTEAQVMFGYDREAMLGQSVTNLVPALFGRQVESDLPSAIERAAHRGTAPVETQGLRRDGGRFPVEVRLGRAQSGGLVSLLVTDMTERRRLEIERRQAQKMEAIGTLAGGIAHDFNNILGAISGYAELGLLSAEDPALVEYLTEMLNAARRAEELVKQILTFSRQTEQEKRPLHVRAIAGEVVKLLRASLPSTIDIHLRAAPDCAPIVADPTQIHQVIMNLSTNAYHAMRESGGRLDLELVNTMVDPDLAARVSGLRPGPYVRLTVADTGHGMSPDTIGRIFEPYYTTKPLREGTGLGLATVHGIVAEHDGAIEVVSTPGVGSTFRIYFPAVPEVVAEDTSDSRPEQGPGGRVLLVDDEPVFLKAMRGLVAHLGYEVEATTSSTDALAALQHDPDGYDLLLTDQTMPDLTGGQLAAEALRLRPDLPVVLMTGYSDIMNAEVASELGIREFMLKPVSRHTLAEVLARTLRPASS